MSFYKLFFFDSKDEESYYGFTIKFHPKISIENYTFTTQCNFSKIVDVNTTASFTLDKSIKIFEYDFIISSDNIILGSDDFCRILSKFEPSFNFINVLGKYHNGKPVEKKYKAINVGGYLDAIDYRESDYNGKVLVLSRISKNKSIPLIKEIKKLIINKDVAEKRHFFFLDNTTLFNPIISEELKKSLEISNLHLEYKKLY